MNKKYDKFEYSFSLRTPKQTRSNSFKIVRTEYSLIDSFTRKEINDAERNTILNTYPHCLDRDYKILEKYEADAEAYKNKIQENYNNGLKKNSPVEHRKLTMDYDDEALATEIILDDLESSLEYTLERIQSGYIVANNIDYYYKAMEFCINHIEELEAEGKGTKYWQNKYDSYKNCDQKDKEEILSKIEERIKSSIRSYHENKIKKIEEGERSYNFAY